MIERGYTRAQIEAVLNRAETTYFDSDAYEYADNVRIARQDNEEECLLFSELEENGCCGCYDEEIQVTEPDGSTSTILFGFNYGH